jgi:hypothetical protein
VTVALAAACGGDDDDGDTGQDPIVPQAADAGPTVTADAGATPPPPEPMPPPYGV